MCYNSPPIALCCDQDAEMLYLVLEFLNGGELFTLLGLKSRLSNDTCRAL